MELHSEVDQSAAEQAVRDLLAALGHDVSSERLLLTPQRVVKTLRDLTEPGGPLVLPEFANESGYDDVVVLKDIEFVSMCEHHLLPFRGKAHVGYLPNGTLAGLSSLAHTVEHYAKALTLQEDLTAAVADHLQAHLKARAVGVVTIAEHQCVTIRGVKAHGTSTLMRAFRGEQRDDAAFRSAFA